MLSAENFIQSVNGIITLDITHKDANDVIRHIIQELSE